MENWIVQSKISGGIILRCNGPTFGEYKDQTMGKKLCNKQIG